MEKIDIRYNVALEALSRFKEDIEIINKPKIDVYEKFHRQFRNSVIQSFEFSFDTFWKFIKDYTGVTYNVEFNAPTPRSVFRECTKVGFINENEFNLLSDLVKDRNLTSHTYNEELAEEIVKKLPKYYELMMLLMKRVKITF